MQRSVAAVALWHLLLWFKCLGATKTKTRWLEGGGHKKQQEVQTLPFLRLIHWPLDSFFWLSLDWLRLRALQRRDMTILQPTCKTAWRLFFHLILSVQTHLKSAATCDLGLRERPLSVCRLQQPAKVLRGVTWPLRRSHTIATMSLFYCTRSQRWRGSMAVSATSEGM